MAFQTEFEQKPIIRQRQFSQNVTFFMRGKWSKHDILFIKLKRAKQCNVFMRGKSSLFGCFSSKIGNFCNPYVYIFEISLLPQSNRKYINVIPL